MQKRIKIFPLPETNPCKNSGVHRDLFAGVFFYKFKMSFYQIYDIFTIKK